MRDSEPGLAWRLRFEGDRIASQHDKLDALYADLRDTMKRRDRDAGALRFTRLREALEAHFDVEDQIYFPAAHGLCPDQGADLDRLIDEHTEFRRELYRIELRFGEVGMADVEGEVDRLLDALVRHESVEQGVMRVVAAASAGD